ncbi:hypothetical protein [Prauserella cavernicola]|uniref:Small secreted hydrophilic protein n=1 Tax=Prauserella cavernicola TaxID=2800127 RepID=A0A934QUB8_9PSEU|nr:hypothetical protein [Prauserella cavernicola]MBK1788392.1 hypothetical protein [Prauserella cavernicola]
MSPTPRVIAFVAVLALPVAAVLATLLLSDPSPPRETAPVVRIGESGEMTPPPSGPPTTSGEPSTSGEPTTSSRVQLPPPPPVDDDDDDDDGPDDADDPDDD